MLIARPREAFLSLSLSHTHKRTNDWQLEKDGKWEILHPFPIPPAFFPYVKTDKQSIAQYYHVIIVELKYWEPMYCIIIMLYFWVKISRLLSEVASI